MQNVKPKDVKVFIKPVFVQLNHSGAYEGPCRVGKKEEMGPERERRLGEQNYQAFSREVSENTSNEALILDPIKIEWGDDWVLHEGELEKLDRDARDVDFFLVKGSLCQYPAVRIAHRYQKPIVMVGPVATVDVSAYLRSRGLEGYAPMDYNDLDHLIKLMRVRKAVSRTRILLAREGDTIPLGVVSTLWNLDDLMQRFGIQHCSIASDSIFERMENPSTEESKLAEETTDRLVEGAQAVHMERRDILPSVQYYVAARAIMEEMECNAFSVPCFEICAKRRADEKRVTFCLTHTLMKDQGFPSACEGDLNALLSMALLMYLSGGSAYMGNSRIVDEQEDIMALNHDVPGLRMKGFDAPDSDYEIRNFTVGGWGVTVRYDFSQDIGEPVTLARFDPAASRLLVVEGTICGGRGVDQIGCTLEVNIKVQDVKDLFRKEQDFGHHLSLAYGHHASDLRSLGEMMGFEVIVSR